MNHAGENRTRQHWLIVGVIASLGLHGVFLLLPGWQESVPRPMKSIEISLKYSSEPPELHAELPEAEAEVEPEPEIIPDSPSQPDDELPEPATAETKVSSQEAEPADAAPISGFELRERVLTLVGQEQAQTVESGQPRPLEAAPLPRLPDPPGWLNEYVGSVRPEIDRWGSNDGSRHSRITLANGQVICGRARPPTSAEMFNPSMAMNIMHFGLCGRERPAPADRSDPWLRMPEE